MHPILIEIGDFFIGTYGVMIAIGLLAGITLAGWRGKRRGFSSDLFFDIAFVAVVAGFVSARVFFILQNPKYFAEDPISLILSRTGFVFLGGFIGAVAAVIIFLKKRGLPVLPVADILAPSIALGHAFGRIGCHLAGCCWGGVCDVKAVGIHIHEHLQPNGMPFQNAFVDHVERGLVDPSAGQSLAVWPVQLMESGSLFVLTALLVWFASKPRRPGQTLALYLVGYAVIRFVLEYFRGDPGRGVYFDGMLSTSQIISLFILPAAVGILVWSRGKDVSPHSHPSLAPPPPDDEKASRESEREDSRMAPSGPHAAAAAPAKRNSKSKRKKR